MPEALKECLLLAFIACVKSQDFKCALITSKNLDSIQCHRNQYNSKTPFFRLPTPNWSECPAAARGGQLSLRVPSHLKIVHASTYVRSTSAQLSALSTYGTVYAFKIPAFKLHGTASIDIECNPTLHKIRVLDPERFPRWCRFDFQFWFGSKTKRNTHSLITYCLKRSIV